MSDSSAATVNVPIRVITPASSSTSLYSITWSLMTSQPPNSSKSTESSTVSDVTAAAVSHNSPSYPDQHFDCIFSVSTLEHIPAPERLDVLKDMDRCTAPGGRELHSIDIPIPSPTKTAVAAAAERMGLGRPLASRYKFGIAAWWNLLRHPGIKVTRPPSSGELLSRQVLVESPDVVCRFYPPNDQPKAYRPAASLLIVIEDV